MKTVNLTIASAIALVISFSSCKKDEVKNTPTTTTPTPTSTTGPTPQTPMPSGGNISGALISLKMKYTTQPTGSPMPIDVNSEMGIAVFYTAAGATTMADAGTVSVNKVDLEKQTNKSYLKTAFPGGTPADLDFDNTSKWVVGGSSDVSAFSYDHNRPFPEYTGELPSSITKADGLSLTLNSTTLSVTDSVYVVVAAGNKSFVKSYGANAGIVKISAADLQSLPVVSDNSAILEVCPFSYQEAVENGKSYFFIKELAVVKAININ